MSSRDNVIGETKFRAGRVTVGCDCINGHRWGVTVRFDGRVMLVEVDQDALCPVCGLPDRDIKIRREE